MLRHVLTHLLDNAREALPAGGATITTSPSGLSVSTAGAGCVPGTYVTPVTLLWTPERNCTLMDPDTVGEICRSSGIPREESDRFIEELHDLGHILHSKDVDDLSGQVVLRPEWAKDAIYEVFDSPDIGECNGILSKGVLARIWNDGTDRFPRRSHGYLLDLMEHYELGFPTDDKRNYVFPYFLSRERPAGTVFNEAGTTCIEYEYKRFSHVSLIARFIVRMHNYLARVDAKELCWQTGGILTLADTPEAPDYDGLDQPRALVEYHDEYRKVTVKVTGTPVTAAAGATTVNVGSAVGLTAMFPLAPVMLPLTASVAVTGLSVLGSARCPMVRCPP